MKRDHKAEARNRTRIPFSVLTGIPEDKSLLVRHRSEQEANIKLDLKVIGVKCGLDLSESVAIRV